MSAREAFNRKLLLLDEDDDIKDDPLHSELLLADSNLERILQLLAGDFVAQRELASAAVVGDEEGGRPTLQRFLSHVVSDAARVDGTHEILAEAQWNLKRRRRKVKRQVYAASIGPTVRDDESDGAEHSSASSDQRCEGADEERGGSLRGSEDGEAAHLRDARETLCSQFVKDVLHVVGQTVMKLRSSIACSIGNGALPERVKRDIERLKKANLKKDATIEAMAKRSEQASERVQHMKDDISELRAATHGMGFEAIEALIQRVAALDQENAYLYAKVVGQEAAQGAISTTRMRSGTANSSLLASYMNRIRALQSHARKLEASAMRALDIDAGAVSAIHPGAAGSARNCAKRRGNGPSSAAGMVVGTADEDDDDVVLFGFDPMEGYPPSATAAERAQLEAVVESLREARREARHKRIEQISAEIIGRLVEPTSDHFANVMDVVSGLQDFAASLPEHPKKRTLTKQLVQLKRQCGDERDSLISTIRFTLSNSKEVVSKFALLLKRRRELRNAEAAESEAAAEGAELKQQLEEVIERTRAREREVKVGRMRLSILETSEHVARGVDEHKGEASASVPLPAISGQSTPADTRSVAWAARDTSPKHSVSCSRPAEGADAAATSLGTTPRGKAAVSGAQCDELPVRDISGALSKAFESSDSNGSPEVAALSAGPRASTQSHLYRDEVADHNRWSSSSSSSDEGCDSAGNFLLQVGFADPVSHGAVDDRAADAHDGQAAPASSRAHPHKPRRERARPRRKGRVPAARGVESGASTPPASALAPGGGATCPQCSAPMQCARCSWPVQGMHPKRSRKSRRSAGGRVLPVSSVRELLESAVTVGAAEQVLKQRRAKENFRALAERASLKLDVVASTPLQPKQGSAPSPSLQRCPARSTAAHERARQPKGFVAGVDAMLRRGEVIHQQWEERRKAIAAQSAAIANYFYNQLRFALYGASRGIRVKMPSLAQLLHYAEAVSKASASQVPAGASHAMDAETQEDAFASPQLWVEGQGMIENDEGTASRRDTVEDEPAQLPEVITSTVAAGPLHSAADAIEIRQLYGSSAGTCHAEGSTSTRTKVAVRALPPTSTPSRYRHYHPGGPRSGSRESTAFQHAEHNQRHGILNSPQVLREEMVRLQHSRARAAEEQAIMRNIEEHRGRERQRAQQRQLQLRDAVFEHHSAASASSRGATPLPQLREHAHPRRRSVRTTMSLRTRERVMECVDFAIAAEAIPTKH